MNIKPVICSTGLYNEIIQEASVGMVPNDDQSIS